MAAGADEWSPAARCGFGIGLCVAILVIALLIPVVRQYLLTEWENQPKVLAPSSTRLLTAALQRLFIGRLLALASFGIQSGAIVNNFIQATNSDFDCKTSGCGNSWYYLEPVLRVTGTCWSQLNPMFA